MEIPLPQNVKSRKKSFYTYKFSSTLNVRWEGDEIDRLAFHDCSYFH